MDWERRGSSIYQESLDRRSNPVHSDQGLFGLGIFYDMSNEADEKRFAFSEGDSISYRPGFPDKIVEQLTLIEEKPLPPLPSEAFPFTTKFDRAWEQVDSATQQHHLSSIYPTHGNGGENPYPNRPRQQHPRLPERPKTKHFVAIDEAFERAGIQPRKRHYALPTEPSPKHLATLDRAFEKALLRPRPLQLYSNMWESPTTESSEAEEENVAIPNTQSTRSVEGTVYNHGLRESKLQGDAQETQQSFLEGTQRLRASSNKAMQQNETFEQENVRPKHKKVRRQLGLLLRQMRRTVAGNFARRGESLTSDHVQTTLGTNIHPPINQPESQSHLEAEGSFIQSLDGSDIGTEKNIATIPRGSSPELSTHAQKRIKRLFSILIEPPISIDVSERLGSQDEESLCLIINQMRTQLIESLEGTGQAPRVDSIPARPTQRAQGTMTINETSGTSSNLSTLSSTFINETPYELDGTALKSVRPEIFPFLESDHRIVSRESTETTILRILQQINTLEDLFAMATVNKAVYRVFKTHGLSLIKNALWKMSPAAWEHREISECASTKSTSSILDGGEAMEASLYLRHYMRDLDTVARIKILLLAHCTFVLREDTVAALLLPDSERSAALDDAIWRVWTFSQLFSASKGREKDLQGQFLWLRGQSATGKLSHFPNDFDNALFGPPCGFGEGNCGGLDRGQLRDMVEIWTAMATLLDFLRAETERARRFGVFDVARTADGNWQTEELLLTSWIQYLVTLGPSVILTVAPFGPATDPELAFHRAKSYGWTDWPLPDFKNPRSEFLTGVISAFCSSTYTSFF